MQTLIDLLSKHPALALAVVFSVSPLEAVAVIGTVIPGSSVVVVAGMLVGLQVLNPWWVAGLAVIGATPWGQFQLLARSPLPRKAS